MISKWWCHPLAVVRANDFSVQTTLPPSVPTCPCLRSSPLPSLMFPYFPGILQQLPACLKKNIFGFLGELTGKPRGFDNFIFVRTSMSWCTLLIIWYSRQPLGIKVQSCLVLR